MKLNKLYKTTVCLLTAIAAAAGFTACGGDNLPDTTPNPTNQEKTPINEFVETMGNDEYTVTGVNGTYGLSEPLNTGVDKSKMQEIKYPVSPDSGFEAGAILEFDSFEGNYENDTKRLEALVAAAKTINGTGKNVKIKLPDRAININADISSGVNYAVAISGFNGLQIEGGENTVLMIETPSAWKGGLSIDNCSNIRIQNVKTDYKTSPALKGIVTSYDIAALSVTMEIPAEFEETVNALKDNAALGGTLYSYIEYDKYTLAPRENGNILIRGNGFFDSCAFDTSGGKPLFTVVFTEGYRNNFKAPRTGELVALGFAMYGNGGTAVSLSENVYFEGCGVYTCPGMAFVASDVNNLYVNRFDIALKGERIMTATADGFHIAGCTGDVSITNSVIENTHDDALNIKAGYYYSLSSTDAISRTLTIAKKTSAIPLAKEGDILEVYGQADFSFRGRFTVVSASGTESVQTVTVKERIAGDVSWTNCVVTDTSITPRFTFANNIVRNKRNRGILVQVRGAVIENNTFKNIGHGSVSVHSSLDVFNEATMPKDITVRNNKFINNGYLLIDALRGDVSAFAIAEGGKVAPSGTLTGIKISNNYIENSGNAGISLRGAGTDSYIKNNLFYNPARVSSSEMTECAIELDNVSVIEISGNYNYYTLESETFAGIITAGLTKTENINLTENTNLYYQEFSSGELLKTEVKKIQSSVVAIDGSLDEWSDKGTAVEMVASSLATGDRIDPSAYADVFGVEMCKIAWSESGIYFAFKVRDNKLDFKTENNFWNGDCVELFMSEILEMPNADFQLYRNEGDVLQMAFVPSLTSGYTFGLSRTSDSIMANKASILVKTVTVTGGYQGEMFIPFTVSPGVQAKTVNGEYVAMAFVFADNDRDDIGRKRLQVANVPHFVEAYKTKTAKMPLFKFVE